MELTQLEYFVTVAKTGSITKAADRLFITQSALSKVISRLETDVGVQLFNRENKRLKLNDAGEEFLRHAEQALKEIAEATHCARSIGQEGNTIINIATSVPPLLNLAAEEYLLEREGARITLDEWRFKDILDRIVDNELDFGLCMYHQIKDARVMWTPLMDEDLYALVSRQSKLAKSHSLNLSDLKWVPLLGVDRESDMFAWVTDLCQSVGFFPNIVYSCSTLPGISRFLELDRGVFIMAAGDCRRLLEAQPELDAAAIPIRTPSCTRTLGIVRRRDHALLGSAKDFYNYLLDYIRRYNALNMEFNGRR